MRNTRIVLVFLMIGIGLSVTDWVEEKSSLSFDLLTSLKSIDQIIWGKKVANTLESINLCFTQTFICIENTGYKSNLTKFNETYKSVFTIESVSLQQHNTMWGYRLMNKEQIVKENYWDLKVFAPPANISCKNVILISDINIQVKCVTENVFPNVICVFYVKTNNTIAVPIKKGSIHYINYTPSNAGYNITECTYTVSAVFLEPGTHVFYVDMYANITSNITEAMKRKSSDTVPIIIDYPEAVLGQDCNYIKYIKENQSRTCTCFDNKTTFLPTTVDWPIGGSTNGTLNFIAQRPSSNDPQNLECIISNALNLTSRILYPLIVAYPPSIKNVSLSQTEIEMCSEKKITILATCFISKSYPDPTVYVTLDGALVEPKIVTNSNEYRSIVSINSTGIFNISCNSYNDAFLDSVSIENKRAIIKGPPDKPKIFRVVNGLKLPPSENIFQVTEGEITIMCESTGGYPNLKNITVACENQVAITSTIDTVRLNLNITQSMTLKDITCTCVVSHESTCLQNETAVLLKYPLDIKNLSLTQTDVDVCYDHNVTILGTCFISKSYPVPTVYSTVNGILIENTFSMNSSEYRFNVPINSPGIFNITCNAYNNGSDNLIYSKIETAIIKGPPETPKIFKFLDGVKILPSEHILQVTGGESTIICESTGGYPKITNLTLSCDNQKATTSNKTAVILTLSLQSLQASKTLTCTCFVWHESKCLQNVTSVELRYVSVESNYDFKSIYIGVGVAFGIIFTICALLLSSKIRFGQLKRNSSSVFETFENNADLYFIKEANSFADISSYPEYTNVITTMSSAIQAPKNLKTRDAELNAGIV